MAVVLISPFFCPSQVPSDEAFSVISSAVGERAEAKPSLTFTDVMPSHLIVSVQSLITADLPLIHWPAGSRNDIFEETISSNFFASFALNASQPEVWIFTRASVLASGVGFAEAVVFALELEAELTLLFAA